MKKIVALVLSLVMVLGLATVATAAPAAIEYWELNPTTGAWQVNDGMTDWIADNAEDLSDLELDDDNYLPGYKVSASYFVEVPEAQANFKLTYGTKTVFLKSLADASTLYFDYEAKVFTNVSDDATECGTLTYDLDEDDVFYSRYIKATKSYEYYVKGGAKDVVLLVDGKLVKAESVGTQLNGHDWLGYDVVNYEYTTVKCEDCGKVAMLYANATAAGKNAQKVGTLGWITLADATDFGAVATAPEAGETVESAKTFDAGIAMYVGMSVMAAAGSAVVLKKKD